MFALDLDPPFALSRPHPGKWFWGHRRRSWSPCWPPSPLLHPQSFWFKVLIDRSDEPTTRVFSQGVTENTNIGRTPISFSIFLQIMPDKCNKSWHKEQVSTMNIPASKCDIMLMSSKKKQKNNYNIEQEHYPLKMKNSHQKSSINSPFTHIIFHDTSQVFHTKIKQ